MSSRSEGAVCRVAGDGSYGVFAGGLGTARGMAFSPDGTPGNLVGVAFDPPGGVVAASNDTAYRPDPGAAAIGRPELL